MNRLSICIASACLIAVGAGVRSAPGGLPQQGAKRVSALDFSSKTIPSDWSLSTNKWKVDDGELLGEGSGNLDFRRDLDGDFTLTFDAWTEEKANIEITLSSSDGKKTYYVLAFLGQYHPVLDGMKSAILEGNTFVSIEPRMWIFPGRFFTFEVRRAKNQFQMFLDGELGPVFKDESAEMKEYRVRISCSTEGKKDSVRIDNVRIVAG